MLARILSIIVDVVGSFFVYLLLVRFHFQWLRAPFHNQVGEFVIACTNWIVKPARRIVPPLLGLDLATLAAAWLLQIVCAALLLMIAGTDLAAAPGAAFGVLAGLAAVDLLQYSLRILMFIVILQAVLSWVNPYNPLQPLLDAVSRPFLRPIRRFVPPLANVDLSPLILIVVVLILHEPLAELRKLVTGLV
jgi:YggT family protein